MITNILLTQGGYNRGYLPKTTSPVLQPSFATANVAIRRSTINEIGLFDTDLKTGEDMDLSIRVAQTSWSLYYEARAVIRHKHRTTLIALMKQWYGYGRYHGRIFKKYRSKSIEICWRSISKEGIGWSSYRRETVFGVRVPFHLLLFITPFHLFHLSLLFLAFFHSGEFSPLTVTAVFAAIYFGSKNLISNFTLDRPLEWFLFSCIRYLLNWIYFIGGFWGGLRNGVIYIECTREKNPSFN